MGTSPTSFLYLCLKLSPQTEQNSKNEQNLQQKDHVLFLFLCILPESQPFRTESSQPPLLHLSNSAV